MRERDTAIQILDSAQFLAQTRGYNGFSYADIATEVGIRTASIHHHFPGKSDLGRQLITRYHAAFHLLFAQIDRETDDPRQKLTRYVQAFLANLRDGGRMCLCGMMASDLVTLPPSLQVQVRDFFDANETWLAHVLADGRQTGTLSFAGSPEAEARLLFASLEGAMLVARSFGDPDRFETLAGQLLAALEGRR